MFVFKRLFGSSFFSGIFLGLFIGAQRVIVSMVGAMKTTRL
jgi:hypothetical protein